MENSAIVHDDPEIRGGDVGDAFVENVKISDNMAEIYTAPYLGGEYGPEEPEPPERERGEDIPVIHGEIGTGDTGRVLSGRL